jgi:DNA repair exonuclease SbcCD ATPase subunit
MADKSKVAAEKAKPLVEPASPDDQEVVDGAAPPVEGLVSVEAARAMILDAATAEGRCPECGRRHDSEEAELFDRLRTELADARQERDDARRDLEAAQDSNALYEAENASLKRKLVEAG